MFSCFTIPTFWKVLRLNSLKLIFMEFVGYLQKKILSIWHSAKFNSIILSVLLVLSVTLGTYHLFCLVIPSSWFPTYCAFFYSPVCLELLVCLLFTQSLAVLMFPRFIYVTCWFNFYLHMSTLPSPKITS